MHGTCIISAILQNGLDRYNKLLLVWWKPEQFTTPILRHSDIRWRMFWWVEKLELTIHHHSLNESKRNKLFHLNYNLKIILHLLVRSPQLVKFAPFDLCQGHAIISIPDWHTEWMKTFLPSFTLDWKKSFKG